MKIYLLNVWEDATEYEHGEPTTHFYVSEKKRNKALVRAAKNGFWTELDEIETED